MKLNKNLLRGGGGRKITSVKMAKKKNHQPKQIQQTQTGGAFFFLPLLAPLFVKLVLVAKAAFVAARVARMASAVIRTATAVSRATRAAANFTRINRAASGIRRIMKKPKSFKKVANKKLENAAEIAEKGVEDSKRFVEESAKDIQKATGEKLPLEKYKKNFLDPTKIAKGGTQAVRKGLIDFSSEEGKRILGAEFERRKQEKNAQEGFEKWKKNSHKGFATVRSNPYGLTPQTSAAHSAMNPMMSSNTTPIHNHSMVGQTISL